jgi:hypothetical protein
MASLCYSESLLGIQSNPTMSLERFGYREFSTKSLALLAAARPDNNAAGIIP